MKTYHYRFPLFLVWLGWMLAACDATLPYRVDPNISSVQARATLEFIQAIQTSTAQAQAAAEWQATIQAAATQDAVRAEFVAAQATNDSLHAAAAATQTQQVWNATATTESSRATATAAANATAESWSSTATQSAWFREATVEAASLQAYQTAQAAQADISRLAAERQRMVNKVQAAAPWVILAIIVPLVAYLAWLWGRAEALRRSAIPRDPRGDAPILILDHHGRRNIIDPDLLLGAVISIGKQGQVETPLLAAPEIQMQIKARDQAVDLVNRGLPGQGHPRRTLPASAQAQPVPALDNIRIVQQEEVKDWLEEVMPRIQRRALQEGASEDD